MTLRQWKMNSKIGPLYLAASEKGLRGVFWHDPKFAPIPSLAAEDPESRILSQASRELGEYLEGTRKTFEVPLDLVGTPFQRLVWEELLKIPYGETISYRQLADRIHNPGAIRAVGAANGKNPVSILVPCHRVIASDGSLGGYAGGLPVKARLLQLEAKREWGRK
ncbi:MAG: methylated-DNA--[protein]-cysteine S-methyltransferase [bacterium]